MKYIPIGCKQIAFLRYDDQSSQIYIQYHTGQTKVCDGIDQDQVQRLLQSDNPYDLIMNWSHRPHTAPQT